MDKNKYDITEYCEFWNQVKKYRNMYFLIWISWPIVGMILWSLLLKIFGSKYPFFLGLIVFAGWGYLWCIPGKKAKSLVCPQCKKSDVVGHFYFFMKHAKCRNCGLPFIEEKCPDFEREYFTQDNK